MDSGREVVYVTKRLQFSSAHSLRCPTFTVEENEATYGKCVGLHGHNYVVKITLRGPVNPRTGFFINIGELKQLMQQYIMKQLDHVNLDDIPYFKDRVSTGENIAVFVWKQMEAALGSDSSLLYEVALDETENNCFIYRGEKQSQLS